MAAKKKNQNPFSRLIVLAAIVGVFALFVCAVFVTDALFSVAPIAFVGVTVVFIALYNAITAGLLYDFYEVEAPWYRFVPCFGEFATMDSSYIKIGLPLYITSIAVFAIGRLPYTVFSFLGEELSIRMPFYTTVLALVFALAIQVVKGIGFLNCMKTVEAEWEERMHTSLGLIKSFSLLGFIPFVRVATIYAINKPLSTLVTFMDITYDNGDEVALEEE